MAPAAEKPIAEQLGPHPSYIQVAKPFIFQQKIEGQIIATGANPQREDAFRLNGVQWIDDTRRALQLPVRTFDTAVIYFHKFRLVHRDTEYSYPDAAAAALFTACKIEDTLKKSKEILCASYNLKVSPSEHLTPDDNVFEVPSKTIIGLERLMLEASGFDYRNRYPQKYLFKLAKQCKLDRDVVRTAYKMMLDLYRTFAPLKLASATMAFVCLELSARVLNKQLDNVRNEHGSRNNKWKVPRAQVIEGILDLLDLYTHFQRGTIVGPAYSIDHFIGIRLAVNEEAKTQKCPRYSEWIEKRQNGIKSNIKTPKTPITPASPSDTRVNGNANVSPATLSPRSSGSGRKGVGARGQEGTVRFMLDAAQAKKEKETVAEYFKIEYEDYEIEIDEPVRAAPVNDDRHRRDDRGARNGNGRRDRYDRHDRDFKRPRR